MPKTPMLYENTVIYKIVCNDLTITEIYVGHTTNFTKRKYKHKHDCKTKMNKKYVFIRLEQMEVGITGV
jgi:predicted GIY-YIG superfamily endonuclease